jgi:hypothetical protein
MEHTWLSILICHLASRKKDYDALIAKLTTQTIVNGNTEILTETDNGEISIGAKRNKLLYAAKGKYIAYIDDDDDVSNDYIESVLDAVQSMPDCIGIEGQLVTPQGTMLFRHSIQFQGWYTGVDAFYRTPNHLNPIKRTIAQRIGFKDCMNGEDQIYSDALKRMLKTEVYINHPIYFYKKDYSK